MKCDLCKHRELHSKNNLLCESCAEMIERLVVVQNRMDSHESHRPKAAAAPATGISPWGQWQ
jgi:hypothetical protein